jgi:hypothetical protein
VITIAVVFHRYSRFYCAKKQQFSDAKALKERELAVAIIVK